MALTTEEKKKIIGDSNQTGSSEVQIDLLTLRIKKLSEHIKKNKKDYSAERAVHKIVSKRKRFLLYLKKHNNASYLKISKGLEKKN